MAGRNSRFALSRVGVPLFDGSCELWYNLQAFCSEAYSIGDCVLQRLLWIGILLVIVLWIVLSYVPAALVPLPTFSFVGGEAMAYAAVVALLLLLTIQTWIVFATVRSVRTYDPQDSEKAPRRPSLRAEFFWTALPIAMTLALAWASYSMWIRLLTP